MYALELKSRVSPALVQAVCSSWQIHFGVNRVVDSNILLTSGRFASPSNERCGKCSLSCNNSPCQNHPPSNCLGVVFILVGIGFVACASSVQTRVKKDCTRVYLLLSRRPFPLYVSGASELEY